MGLTSGTPRNTRQRLVEHDHDILGVCHNSCLSCAPRPSPPRREPRQPARFRPDNVMTPLVQGHVISGVLRAEFKASLLHSPDPQIAYWPKFRSFQISLDKSIIYSAPRPLFRVDFSAALSKA